MYGNNAFKNEAYLLFSENKRKLEENWRNIQIPNSNREFIGGRHVRERARRETTKRNLRQQLTRVLLLAGKYKSVILSVAIGLEAIFLYNIFATDICLYNSTLSPYKLMVISFD